jgi:uncharacterized surface protein with fasciclin (FAS1) repeats
MTSNRNFMIAAAAAALLAGPALADPAPAAAPKAAASPATPAVEPSATARPAPNATADIVDVVKADRHFSTFARVVEAAGLTAELEGAEPMTVFAPTDAAFQALPAGTLDTLLKPENRAKLVALVNYHVVPAAATSQQLNGRTVRATSISGQQLTIDARSGVKVNDATVVRADMKASNGVVHAVDKVLTPPA